MLLFLLIDIAAIATIETIVTIDTIVTIEVIGGYKRLRSIGATIYLTGLEGDKYAKAECCIMCKRYLINAGIEKVYYRIDKDNYEEVKVSDWIENDEGIEMLKNT